MRLRQDHRAIHPGGGPWPRALAGRAEAALRRALTDGQPVLEVDQPVIEVAGVAQRLSPAARPGASPGTGRERHWAFSWFPWDDGDTNVTGVVLIAADITDRQQSAEAVRRSEARYRSLVQARAGGVGDLADRGDRGGLTRVALDHRPVAE